MFVHKKCTTACIENCKKSVQEKMYKKNMYKQFFVLKNVHIIVIAEANTDTDNPQVSIKNEDETEQKQNEIQRSKHLGDREQPDGTIVDVNPDGVVEDGNNLTASDVDKDGEGENGNSDRSCKVGDDRSGFIDSSLDVPMSRLHMSTEKNAL